MKKKITKKTKKPVNKNTKTYKLKELRRLSRKCLKLRALVVKMRAGNVCEIGQWTGTACSAGSLNDHHIENYRTNKVLRFEPDNGLCCCPGHHKYYIDSVHKSFITLYEYMKECRPSSLKFIKENHLKKVELTKEYLEDKIHEFEMELGIINCGQPDPVIIRTEGGGSCGLM